MSKIIKKGFASNDNVSIDSDMEKINRHTIKELKPEDVFTFKVRLCDSKVDRVGDKFTDEALQQIVDLSSGLTGIQDHDWESDNQRSRLYDAEIVTSEDEVDELGKPVKYVLGKAYTLSKYTDYIDKIAAGLLKEVSISFNNEGDTCSICGKPMHKNCDGIGICEDGHVAGQVYDGLLCYNSISNITDLLEWSLVAVPCQKNSAISKNLEGGNGLMKKAELLIRKFIASKKSLPEEEKKGLEEALVAEAVDLTDEDIKALVDENASLKARVKELEDAVAGFDAERESEKIKGCVGKAFEGCGLITPEVKGLLEKELPWETFKMSEDGQTVVGLDEAMEALKEQYKGLFKSEEAPETKVEETKVEEVKTEEEKVEEPEVKVEVETKSLQKPSFMTFGSSAATSKSYENSAKRQGIFIN